MDVLGLGAVAVDDVLHLDSFPHPDTKVRVQRRERRAGGNTGTALVAARRMGKSCDYAGALGDDELSRYITATFEAEGVSVRHVAHRPGARPVHAIILNETATRTRTILFDDNHPAGADDELPAEDVIRSARVLIVDHVGLRGMVRAARIARAAGIPIVADLERDQFGLLAEMLALSGHLILPYDFARTLDSGRTEADIVRALWRPDRSTVVITRGAQGCWYLSSEEPGTVFHQPGFHVAAVDTTGCGDIFHGVYAAGLSEGMGAEQRIRFASAVAALKASRQGGQAAIPLRTGADQFLKERAGEARRAAL